MSRPLFQLRLPILVISLAAACSPLQAVTIMEEDQMSAVVSATDTGRPGTPSPNPPASTATATTLPTATYSPAHPVAFMEDISAVWLVYLMGGGEGDPAHWTFRLDGTYTLVAVGGYHEGMEFDHGTYHVEDGDLLLETDYCFDSEAKDYEMYHCLRRYQVVVWKQNGLPVKMHMRAIEDPVEDARLSFDDKTFYVADG